MDRLIRKWIPKNYSLEWKGTLNSPLVYRSQVLKPSATTLIKAWIEALRKATGISELEEEKYTRFNVQMNDETIAISIYKNSTVMMQGHEPV